jgi:MFS family permease
MFGLLYFVQGLTEPTDGLLAQPINSLLKSWGKNAEEIASFSALFFLPWAVKPIYGLLSDFVPLAGYHRKSYLVAASAMTSAALGLLYLCDLRSPAMGMMLLLLVPATIGVAFSDVVIDALMVEKGQPRGLTGRFQAVQWGSLYGASILAGWAGGYLSQESRQSVGFLICSALTGCTAIVCMFVSDPRAKHSGRQFASTLAVLRHAAASRRLLAMGAFLFCWNFNPFSMTVLYIYITKALKLGAEPEQFYGNMMALYAVAAMIGSLGYGLYCRRVPLGVLVRLSIVLGIASSIGYWALAGTTSALVIGMGAGFATATATVIQLDLAARICPPQTAGTLFALLLGLSNLGTALSMAFGGWCYEHWLERWGNPFAFNLLVAIGALFTAGCWLIVPWLGLRQAEFGPPSDESTG